MKLTIVIPARAEPELSETVRSLLDCEYQDPWGLVIVFNHALSDPKEVKELNESSRMEIDELLAGEQQINYHSLSAYDLSEKDAGVGMARRIAMDRAAEELSDNDVIINLDADCLVSKNYLQGIYSYFQENNGIQAASIYFEHRLDQKDLLNEGIIKYELHLRYYNSLLHYSGHPYAFHTVGSSMAVRKGAYLRQGRMNKRKAGEDFYFLQKHIQVGNFGEINSVIVKPSARLSERVPFGTGRAMLQYEANASLLSYHPDAHLALKDLFEKIADLYHDKIIIDPLIHRFLGEGVLLKKIKEIRKNTKDLASFRQRFYQWFNLFICFKYMHFYRDEVQVNISVEEAAASLLDMMGESTKDKSAMELLEKFREIEKRRGLGM